MSDDVSSRGQRPRRPPQEFADASLDDMFGATVTEPGQEYAEAATPPRRPDPMIERDRPAPAWRGWLAALGLGDAARAGARPRSAAPGRPTSAHPASRPAGPARAVPSRAVPSTAARQPGSPGVRRPRPLPPHLDPRLPMRRHRRPKPWLVAALAAVAVVIGVVIGVLVVPGGSPSPSAAARSTASPTAAAAPTTAPTTSSPTTTTASRSPAPPATAAPVSIAGVTAYDPDGDGEEHNGDAKLAIDHDAGTAWATDRYSRPDLGGLKPGVGLIVDLGSVTAVHEVSLDLGRAGTGVALYLGDSRDGLLHGKPVAEDASAPAHAHLTLPSKSRGRYLLVWLTKLPPTSGGGYRGTIAGISVTG